eukprot:11697793-Alexandrium_andersonii.AAC.1
MSDVGEVVRPGGVFDDVDAEMGYLMGLLESPPQEWQGGRCLLASSAPEDAPGFVRALFAAGATPGE